MAEIGSLIGEKYEIVKQIGQGGMSTVYLAVDRHLGKRWAVKEIRKYGDSCEEGAVVNSLLAEADIMIRLDHPALPRIVDIFEDGRTIQIVMDYIEGVSLDVLLAEQGAQPEELVLEWARQICDALRYLHTRKPPIIYRDMKPANVMLCPGGGVRIIDFGIAREYKERRDSDTTELGTRGYASPEHYGARQTDARSDIYTLGMTLHHLLTGVSPRTPGYVYYPVRHWDPELSPGIEAVIDRCTALDPDDRYPDCQALMYDLRHIRSVAGGVRKKQRKKRRLFLATAALSAALFTTGAALGAWKAIVVQDRYDTLVSVISSLSLEEKLKNYEEAVRLRPDDTTAYLRMVDAFEEEGSINRTRSDEFLTIYNAGRELFDPASPDTAELNYRIGVLYFNCYEDEDEGYSFSACVQKAWPFFAANHDNPELPDDFEDGELSECCYLICSFYRTYVLNPLSGEEASEENYAELIESMDGCVDNVLEYEAYDQLTLYNAVFLLLYDQRENMAAAGVDEDAVLGLMDRVRARSVVLTVRKEQSAALQREILDNYTEYREAVVRAYNNAEEEGYG